METKRMAIVTLLLLAATGGAMAQEELYVEGFARLLAAGTQGDYASDRGIQAPSSWEYAIDGTQQVEWETAPVPAAAGAARATLVWACGLSRQPGPHQLSLNGEEILSFEGGASPEEKRWQRGDYTLRFQPMLRDFSGEVHGVMYLSVPASRLEPGRPARLQVRGAAGGNGAWFMLHHFTDAYEHARSAALVLPSGHRLLIPPSKKLFIAPQPLAWECPLLLGGPETLAAEEWVTVQARLRQTGGGAELTRSWKWRLEPGKSRFPLNLWPSEQVPEGDGELELTLTDSAGHTLGGWKGAIAVRHLAEFSRLRAQAEQALQAREQDQALPPLLRQVGLPSLSYALVRARREVETWTAVEQLEARYPQVVQEVEWIIRGAEALALGKDPFAGRTGFMFKAYRSELDGKLQPYGLYLPTDFDPRQRYPLVVMLHGYSSNPELDMQRLFGRRGAYQDQGFIAATPYNRGNIGYDNQLGEEDVWRVIQDVHQSCRIDTNRLYLTGLSMGGGGTLHLGLLHADRFAAIAAVCGWSDWHIWAGEQRPPELRQQVLETANILNHAENALNLPVALFHGAADSAVSVEHSRALSKRLKELGYQVEYEEYPGVGHNSWDNAYREGRVFSWFSRFTRNPHPRRVVHTTANPARYGHSYWTRMEELAEPYVFGRLEAQVEEDNRVSVKTVNLTRFSLALSAGLVAMDQPVEVVVDGLPCFAALPPADGRLSFARSGDRFALAQEAWQPALVPFKGLGELRSGWHVYLYGTQGSEAETAAARQAAERLAVINGPVDIAFPVKADTALSEEDLARANLILFGTPRTNAVLARLAGALPVQFGEGQLTLAGETFAAEDLLLVMIHPNPLQPGRYVGIFAPLGPAAYEGLSGMGWGMPDYALLKPDGSAVREGLFDRHWQLRQRAGE